MSGPEANQRVIYTDSETWALQGTPILNRPFEDSLSGGLALLGVRVDNKPDSKRYLDALTRALGQTPVLIEGEETQIMQPTPPGSLNYQEFFDDHGKKQQLQLWVAAQAGDSERISRIRSALHLAEQQRTAEKSRRRVRRGLAALAVTGAAVLAFGRLHSGNSGEHPSAGALPAPTQIAMPHHHLHRHHPRLPAAPLSNRPTPQPTVSPAPAAPSTPSESAPSVSVSPSPATQPPSLPQPEFAIDTVLMSANTDGANHTAPGGNKAWKLSGDQRIHITYNLLKKWHVGAASFEEFEHPTAVEFHNIAGDDYGQFPRAHSGDDTRNSVVWDRSQFKFDSGRFHKELYFNGRVIKIPIVKLMYKATGQEAWFIAFHNPADTTHYHNQGKYRRHDTADEAKLAAHLLKTTHLPVFMMGDTNDHRTHYVCMITNTGVMQDASGGSNGPETPCDPPALDTIDVIMGAEGVKFDNFKKHTGRQVHEATDHASYNTVTMRLPFDYIKPLKHSLNVLSSAHIQARNRRS